MAKRPTVLRRRLNRRKRRSTAPKSPWRRPNSARPLPAPSRELNLKAGELPPRDQPAVTLADLSGWRIETDDVTEIKVPDIKVGQGVTIRFDALPDAELKGEVEAISAVSQVKSGDVVYPVKIKVLDNDPRLRWGMTAAVTFEK